MSYRPYLVADRPSALRVLRGALPDYSATGLGIMTHANVTETVRDFLRAFPSSAGYYDRHDSFEEDDESTYVDADGSLTSVGQRIRDRTTIICDSGAFQKDGVTYESYPELFDQYDSMGVDLGVINDVLNDSEATYAEARQALEVYESGTYDFELVGVAQGTDLESYLRSYRRLRTLGYEKLAIGGLLSKAGSRTGKFAQVSDTAFMRAVLEAIRDEFPRAWLFALGCHHPYRHHLFEKLGIAGADYKGWLFKYKSQFVDKEKARNWRFQELRSFLKQNIFPNGVGSPASRLLILQPSNTIMAAEDLRSIGSRTHGSYMGVVRRWRHDRPAVGNDVDVAFLTDSHGLLNETCLAPPRRTTSTSRIAGNYERRIRSEFASYLRYRKYDEILVAGNQQFRERCRPLKTITGLDTQCDTSVDFTEGRLGPQLSQLREWLHAESSATGSFTVSSQVK